MNRSVAFSLRQGHPVDGPGWVYCWLLENHVVYVGATWLHPAARAQLHLDPGTQDPRSQALQKLLESGLVDVLAFPVAAEGDRQDHREALTRRCQDRGFLSQQYIATRPPSGPSLSGVPTGWLDSAMAELANRITS